MGATLEELQARMSSQEFGQWIAYSRIEPFGWEMDSWRAGMIASQVVNAIRASVPRGAGRSAPKPLKPSDLYPVVAPAGAQEEFSPSQEAYLTKKYGKRRHRHR